MNISTKQATVEFQRNEDAAYRHAPKPHRESGEWWVLTNRYGGRDIVARPKSAAGRRSLKQLTRWHDNRES